MKDHLEIIKKLPLWNKRKIYIKKLNGGITNFNYLVRDREKKYVARFALEDNALLGLNRKREIYNTKIAFASGLGPKVMGFYPKYNLLVVEYIVGDIFSKKTITNNTQIKLIVKSLKILHGGKRLQGKFDPFETIRKYIFLARRNKSWLPGDIDELLAKLFDIEKSIGSLYKNYPCHLDLTPLNIISSNKKIKFIDWEYSASSDFRFDLAMLSVMGHFSRKHDELLIKEYGIKDKDFYKQIQLMKAVVCFREASWGLLQSSISPIKFNYKKYAEKKLSAFDLLYKLI